MDEFDIRKFDSYRGKNRLEVKKAEGGLPASLWETYSAFANTSGGVILLGVCERPDGSFYATGLKDAAKLRKTFFDTVNNKSKVNVKLVDDDDVETYELPEGVIVAIKVPMARRELRPVYINNDIWGGTYRRNDSGDYHCLPGEVRAMLRDQTEETMDMLVLDDFALSDLDPDSVRGYRNYHAAANPGHVWEHLPDDEYLEMIGAAGRGTDGAIHPTGAGLLMFGKEYRITHHFHEYFLDYREMLDPVIRWTDRIQSQSGDSSGNVFDFFFRVYNKIARDFPKPFKLDGVFRVDDTPMHRALREALANCFSNADYYLPRGLVILKDSEKIVLQNPGSIRTGMEQMLKGGTSDPRNKGIMKMWNLLKIGERAGSGVPGIFSVWKECGLPAPTVEEIFDPDRTVVTLPLIGLMATNRRQTGDKPPATNRQTTGDKPAASYIRKQWKSKSDILAFLAWKGEASTNEISTAIGVASSSARELLRKMYAEGLIIAVGNRKARRYKLSDEANPDANLETEK